MSVRVILLGAPGAGKGTQAKMLSKHFGISHISTGDILRLEAKKDTNLAEEIKRYMYKGELVPDDIILKLIEKKINNKKSRNSGFILDGFPRNVLQAESIDRILADKNMPVVVYLAAKEDTIIKRLSGRRVCSKCGANFHIKNMPPKKDMICDFCKAALYQRSDDKEATVRRRLKVYLKETSRLIDYYRKQNRLHEVCADKEANFVFKRIIALINNSLNKDVYN